MRLNATFRKMKEFSICINNSWLVLELISVYEGLFNYHNRYKQGWL